MLDTLHIIMAAIFGGIVVLVFACSLYFNVFEKENERGEPSGGGFWKFILAVIIVIISFVVIGMCSKSDGEWEPRHTQIIKPMKKDVNIFLFSSKATYIL